MSVKNVINKFYNCKCYFHYNIYIEDYDWHFNYFNNEKFKNDYDHILPSLGCDNESKLSVLLKKILMEVNRRKNKEKNDTKRKVFLQKCYRPYDEKVYSLEETCLHPTFIKLVKAAKESNLQAVLQLLEIISAEKRIYRIPIFTEKFCERLLNELDYYNNSDMPKERPNTMNKQGILLDDIGFHDNFCLRLREKYLDCLAQILFPDWRGEKLDSHRIFTVQYKSCAQSSLGYHFDNSEVTLNICLGKVFQEGDIYFGDMNSVPISESTCILVPHKLGYGLLHRGQQLHGTLNVSTGERCNLIMWMRSSIVRNKKCPMCSSKPIELIPASDYGDGFTLNELNIEPN